MMRGSGCWLVMLAVGCLIGVRFQSSVADAACDTECRQKFDFIICNSTSGTPCVSYSAATCTWCVSGGCDNSTAAKAGSCQDTYPSPSTVPVYYFAGCSTVCACTARLIQVQEANTGGSSEQIEAMPLRVCR